PTSAVVTVHFLPWRPPPYYRLRPIVLVAVTFRHEAPPILRLHTGRSSHRCAASRNHRGPVAARFSSQRRSYVRSRGGQWDLFLQDGRRDQTGGGGRTTRASRRECGLYDARGQLPVCEAGDATVCASTCVAIPQRLR